jgi:hypothetical protein
VAGDDFRIIDHVIKALRRAGIPAEEIETFCDEAMSGGDRELLRTCGRWVTLARHWPRSRMRITVWAKQKTSSQRSKAVRALIERGLEK